MLQRVHSPETEPQLLTDGDVVFSGTFGSGLTARTDFINTNAGGVGKTYGFEDSAGASYLFVKGSSDTNNLGRPNG